MTNPRTYGGVYRVAENPDNCIEGVSDGGRSFSVHQCRRLRGHGKDGLYCKSHAKENPTTDSVTIWWQVSTYGVEPIRVTEETDRCLYVQYSEGHRSSRQLKTGKEYRTEREAREAFLAYKQTVLDQAQFDYNKALKAVNELKD